MAALSLRSTVCRTPVFDTLTAGPEAGAERMRLPSRSAACISFLLSILILLLPLMLGGRTYLASTLQVGMIVLVGLVALWSAAGDAAASREQHMWWGLLAVLSAYMWLQVLPVPWLARSLGPYPAKLWEQPDFAPLTWSPNPGATLQGWSVFVALWTVAYSVRHLSRHDVGWLLLAIGAAGVIQAGYGMLALAAGSQEIFGIWPRNNLGWLTGSFPNRNLAAGFLALCWPLSLGIWWVHGMPWTSRLPRSLRTAGTIIGGSLMGLALFNLLGSDSPQLAA
jgi:hypothetical protein